MRSIATIYIPFADYHLALLPRALKSANEQTVTCDVVAGPSPRTPAVQRNLAMHARTPFVVFLDADDVLHSTFVEKCLRVYEEGKYVYTYWYEGDYIKMPRECPWSADSHHIVTTLYPTALFKALGGFDENLPGHEDADFYMRSYANGVCGVLMNEALVARPDDSGQRSKAFNARADYARILQNVAEKNGGMTRIMACCGQSGEPPAGQPGEQLPGDVLAQTLWAGTRSENGHVSGRMYIGGNGSKVWIDPRDVERTPHLFKVVQDLRQLAPKREQVLKESGLV